MKYVLGRRLGPVLGFFVLLASAALNLITPTARVLGGLMRARYFARAQGRPFSLLYGVVLYDQVAHHAVMSVCTWIVLIAGGLRHPSRRPGIPAAGGAARRARRPGPLEPPGRGRARRTRSSASSPAGPSAAKGSSSACIAHGHEAVGVFVRLLGVNKLRFQAVAIGVLYFLVNAAGLWAMFLAIGAPVGPFAALAAMTMGTAVGTLSGTPGGVGTTEVAMMASFKLLGVDEVAAAAGTLLYRGLHYAGVLVVGLPALALLEWRAGAERPASSGGDAHDPNP